MAGSSGYVGYAEGNFSEDTTRGLSPNVWKGFDLDQLLHGVGGWAIFDDFVNGPIVTAAAEAQYGDYKGFADTGGSVAAGDEVGGTLVFSSDGDDEGASLAQRNPAFQLDVGSATGDFVMEMRFKTSTITDTKHGIFAGLIDSATLSATVPIAAAGTLADENFVGFHRLEGDGDALDTVYKADGVTQVTVKEDAYTLTAATYVKVGIRKIGDVLTFFVNGTPLADTKTIPTADGTDFPNDVRMGLVFAVLNATATTPGNSELDWWGAAQRSLT